MGNKRSILYPLLICLFSTQLYAASICLNMIVKDEKDVICRCLESVKPLITYWVIVDTGSTDGTQEIIQEFLKEIPGELHQRSWKNFAHNRNEALELARTKGDYLLFIDADETLILEKSFSMPALDKDYYFINSEFAGTHYSRVQLVKASLDWCWHGVLHEYLYSEKATNCALLQGIYNWVQTDGARSKDPQKFHRDAAILQEALKQEPGNCRYQFYLAQSYRDAGDLALALSHYEKRIQMGGWDQEIFWSQFQVALLKEALSYPEGEVVESYQKAFSLRPARIEPLCRLAHYYRERNQFEEGYQSALKGLAISKPSDLLFVEDWVYAWGLILEYSICAYWTQRYEEAYLATKLLLARQIPQNVQICAENNLVWILDKLQEKEQNRS